MPRPPSSPTPRSWPAPRPPCACDSVGSDTHAAHDDNADGACAVSAVIIMGAPRAADSAAKGGRRRRCERIVRHATEDAPAQCLDHTVGARVSETRLREQAAYRASTGTFVGHACPTSTLGGSQPEVHAWSVAEALRIDNDEVRGPWPPAGALDRLSVPRAASVERIPSAACRSSSRRALASVRHALFVRRSLARPFRRLR